MEIPAKPVQLALPRISLRPPNFLQDCNLTARRLW